MDNRVTQIRRKLEKLNLHLNACLTHAEISQFETHFHIWLPEEYRWFLLHVGDGGDGPPAYGLVPLHHTIQPSQMGRSFAPDQPFPLTDMWIWEGERTRESTYSGAAGPRWGLFYQGHLNLGTDGCGLDWILIVTGAERGNVWSISDVGAGPTEPRQNFLTWYENWLDTEARPKPKDYE